MRALYRTCRAAAIAAYITAALLAGAVSAGEARSTQTAETNGKGGGPWRDRATWASGEVPTSKVHVKVMPGDRVQVDAGRVVRCTGLEIVEGGRVVFDVRGARLTCRGDVTVNGALQMGPGSELLVDCPQNMVHGIRVGADGFFHCRGSNGFVRNCRISAARRDGKHNTFIRLERGANGSFRFCDISYLGGRPPKGRRMRVTSGLFFWVDIVVEGCHFHHCDTAVHLITGGVTIRHNEFSDNGTGLLLYRPTRVTAVGNRFVRNRVGLYARGKHTQASCVVTGNLFEKNRCGMHVSGMLGPASFHRNVYVQNEIGLRMGSANAPVAEECFAGNKYGVELVSGIVGARLIQCEFDVFQGEPMPNREADVLVAGPGPASLVMQSCRMSLDQPVQFAPLPKGKPAAARRVISRHHNGQSGKAREWQAKPAVPGK